MKTSRVTPFLCCMLLMGCTSPVGSAPATATPTITTNAVNTQTTPFITPPEEVGESFSEQILAIPDYSGDFVIEIPGFGFIDSEESYERYSSLDALGRCGPAEALLGKELMSTEPREEIGMVKPSGWHTVKYADLIEDLYLYNRCHLLGYQLSGENANVENLITGTRYLNAEGMLPYENLVANYIRTTGNHVYYRVTPVYDGDNLLCKGVWMEAKSKEDDGTGVDFSVFVYNIQPSIWIDYATGDSCREADLYVTKNYVLNTRSLKFHTPDCKNVADIGGNNKKEYVGTREALTTEGYSPCGWCNP